VLELECRSGGVVSGLQAESQFVVLQPAARIPP